MRIQDGICSTFGVSLYAATSWLPRQDATDTTTMPLPNVPNSNIDKVDSTMDSIREQMDLTNEISDAISNPVGMGHDLDEVRTEAQPARTMSLVEAYLEAITDKYSSLPAYIHTGRAQERARRAGAGGAQRASRRRRVGAVTRASRCRCRSEPCSRHSSTETSGARG